jgi:hypothetical protein
MPADITARAHRLAVLALPLLALLAPVPPAAAGLPEWPSGRMVLDEVADGLRRYRAARTPEAKVAWLRKLAPTRDPGVALALGEVMDNDDDVGFRAFCLLDHYYVPRLAGFTSGDWAHPWWWKNEADLCRRANELPR